MIIYAAQSLLHSLRGLVWKLLKIKLKGWEMWGYIKRKKIITWMFLSVLNLDDIFLGHQGFLFCSRLGAVKRKVCSMCSWDCVNNIYEMNKEATCGYCAYFSYVVIHFKTAMTQSANAVCHIFQVLSSLIAIDMIVWIKDCWIYFSVVARGGSLCSNCQAKRKAMFMYTRRG